MPNYHYKCCKCKQVTKLFLPMSTDPKAIQGCKCGYSMKRIIVSGAQFPKVVGKVWAGDWFKKTYGHDMTDGTERRAKEKKEYDESKRKLEKEEGVRITHRSRQVGGKDRISIPDKKDD